MAHAELARAMEVTATSRFGGLRFALPRTRISLAATFAEDRFLLWTTALLLVGAWVPLFLTPFLPFSDLGVNTASAELIWDTALRHHPAADFYRVQWSPLPYWTTYGLSALLGKLLGPLAAAKILTAFIFALVPLGIMRLLLALGRDARLGLWAFAMSWEHNLYAGWLALLFGLGLVFFVLAWMIEAETVGDGLRLAPYAALIGLTHVQSTWLFGIAAAALTLTTGPVRKRVAIHAAAVAGTVLIMIPWLAGQITPGAGGDPTAAHFTFEWHSPATKLSQFFAYTLDNFSKPDAERAAAMSFVVLILGPLLLGLLPARKAGDKQSPVVLVAVAGGLYTLLPWAITGPISHWYTYPRYSTVILLWLLLVPAPRLRGRATTALIPGILAALLMDVKAGEQLASFGQRTRPFLQIIARVPTKASVLPIVNDDYVDDPDLKLPPYHQMFAYITAFRHGYSPYLWENNSIPLVSRPERALPAPGWDETFSMDEHGSMYDYILVQAFDRGDPVATAVASDGTHPRLLIEAGRWRLYATR